MLRIALFGLFVCWSTWLYADERIRHYDISIDVQQDGDLRIVEHIEVVSEGNRIKRGIFRSFPTRYRDEQGNRYTVGFDVISVERDGRPEPHHIKDAENGKVVYIGSENVMLDPGTHAYTLTFETTRQLGYFDDYDELYFNAIGGGWAFPIEEATVVVQTPQGASVLQHAAYSGPAGSTSCDCETTVSGNGSVVFETTKPLAPGDQFTVAVAWPKGFVEEPGIISNFWFFLRNNINWLIGFAGLLYMLAYFIKTWKSVGVDPKRGAIIPEYRPPEGLTAPASAFVMNMGIQRKSFAAAIVGMATKGSLLIERDGKKKYVLRRKPAGNGAMTAWEQEMAEALFEEGDEITLDNKHYKKFQKARDALKRDLELNWKKEYFELNRQYLLKGFLIALAFGAAMFVFRGANPGWNVPFIMLYIGVLVLFAWLLKAPTKKGRRLMDRIEGFKMYLSVTEKDRLNAAHDASVTPEIFERYLPFAIALGVENEWGERFERSIKGTAHEGYQPAWYHAGHHAAFSPALFSSSLGGSFSNAVSSSSSPPGSSSGSGGGGSSGGGGGGGGGGGW